jgi:hypothetical protein
MVEKSHDTVSDMVYVKENELDGFNIGGVGENIPTMVGESRVPNNIFQAYILVAASIDVTYVGRGDISSGYMGGSYHLSSKNVSEYDNSVNNFNYVDNTQNSIKSSLYSGINMIYFPQDSSFSQFRKVNGDSNDTFTSMSHRMSIYGRSLPPGSLSPGSVLVEVTKVYATLPIAGLEDVCASHSRVNEILPTEMESSHNFIKDLNLTVRNKGDDEKYLKQYLDMDYIEQKEIYDDVQSSKKSDGTYLSSNGRPETEVDRRNKLISLIKNYVPKKTKVDLSNK